MKKLNLLVSLIALFLCVGFVSCGDDDDNNAENAGTGTVFPEGTKKIASIGSGSDAVIFTYNDGKLVSVREDSRSIYKLVYSGSKVTVTYEYTSSSSNDSETMVYTMNIGSNGFVTGGTAVETDVYQGKTDVTNYSYSFSYKDNYVTVMEANSTDNIGGMSSSNINLTWDNKGNLVRCVSTYEDNEDGHIHKDTETYTATYGTESNVAGLSFFDEVGDFDEMEYLYYAGLLGKSTSNLLKSVTDVSSDSPSGSDVTNYTYTFDDNKYPTAMIENGYAVTFTYK